MSAPTLLSALTALPAVTREALSHVVVTPYGGATVIPDAEYGAPQSGPLTREHALLEQLQALAECRLWGQVSWDQQAGPDGDIKVQLWAGPGEREAWRKRLLLAGRNPQALAALAAGGEVKVAAWRRERAMAQLRGPVHAASAANVRPTDLILLTQISRATLYAILRGDADGDAPTATSASGRPAVAWADDTEAAGSGPGGHEVAQRAPSRSPSLDDGSGSAVSSRGRRGPRRGGPDELVRMPSGHSAPCVVCGTPAMTTMGQDPVHGGECLFQRRAELGLTDSRAAAPAAADLVGDSATASASPPRSPRAAAASETPRRAALARRPLSREPRFRALAGALDERYLYLSGGECIEWSARHLGDLAMLVDEHRLGHGGGVTLPERGELWLYPGALERLGLPAVVEIDQMQQAEGRAQQTRALFRELNDLPVVADAMADGWEFAGDRMDQRTRLAHPQRLRAGAHLVAPSWAQFEGLPLLSNEDGKLVEPPELVARLQAFADHVGIAWRITEGVTGLDLIDHTRPPRRSNLDDMGRTVSVVRDEAAQIPSFLNAVSDARLRQIERNFSWWRAWDNLTDQERGMEWVHAYDHRSHFLNPWASTDLGIDGLIHLEGQDARWDGSERAAYYRVSRWEAPDWTMPDPANGVGGWVEESVWVTAHTLKQLEKLSPGLTETLEYHEAFTWEQHARYLDKAGKILAAARADAPAPVAQTVKGIYSAATNKLASRDARPNYHLRRPDWRDMIVGATRTAIVAALVDARNRSGATPMVVDRDTIIYASNEPDPRAAWPGNPTKLEAASGGWRPTHSARLSEWGPSALRKSSGAWLYNRHIAAMTEVNPDA